ncbi:hypothetical protein STENM223S_03581 [Streptomyces tendae]
MGMTGVGHHDAWMPVEPEANPFAGYGSPVAGAEFVGRTAAISSIRNRTFASLETASVSIVGPPRVGKSSLARHVHEQFATGRSARGLTFVPVWITVSGCDSEQSLFRELAHSVQTWLTEHSPDADRMEAQYESLSTAASWDDIRMRLREKRRLSGFKYQVVVVLDEFGAARNIFQRSAEPAPRVTVVAGTSRRVLLSRFLDLLGQPALLVRHDLEAQQGSGREALNRRAGSEDVVAVAEAVLHA